MKYQLVLQFRAEKINDFDQMLKLELELALSLGAEHIVDGHDFSSGEMNIFILTDNPQAAYEKAKESLDKLVNIEYLVAFREREGEKYTVVYPDNFNGEFCLK